MSQCTTDATGIAGRQHRPWLEQRDPTAWPHEVDRHSEEERSRIGVPLRIISESFSEQSGDGPVDRGIGGQLVQERWVADHQIEPLLGEQMPVHGRSGVEPGRAQMLCAPCVAFGMRTGARRCTDQSMTDVDTPIEDRWRHFGVPSQTPQSAATDMGGDGVEFGSVET